MENNQKDKKLLIIILGIIISITLINLLNKQEEKSDLPKTSKAITKNDSVYEQKNSPVDSLQIQEPLKENTIPPASDYPTAESYKDISLYRNIMEGYFYALSNDQYDDLLYYYAETVERFLNQLTPITKYELLKSHVSYHNVYPYHQYELIDIQPYSESLDKISFLVYLKTSIKKNDYDNYKTYFIKDIFTFDRNDKIINVRVIK